MSAELVLEIPSGGIGKPGAFKRGFAMLRQAGGVQMGMLGTGAFIVLLFTVLAVFAPWLSPYGFNDNSAGGVSFPVQSPPNAAHWFGTTTGGGVDVLSQVIYGSRTALEVVVLSVVLAIIVGVPLGLISGYVGGWIDRVLVLITDALFAFPSLLLAIVVSIAVVGGNSSQGGGILAAAVSITVVYIPQYFRVVRNATVSVRERPFVEAARALGAKPGAVMRRYVFGNVVQSVPIIATINGADAILTLAGLGFLGFGIEPSAAAEWGYQLNKALPDMASGIWWTAIFPGTAIVLLVLGLSLIGESLNDVIDPLLRSRRLKNVLLPARGLVDAVSAGTTTTGMTFPTAVAATETNRPHGGEPDEDTVLSVKDLRVWYAGTGAPIKAVDGVSFELKKGQVLGLVGESGCGKSTLGRAMLGLTPPTAGIDGRLEFQGKNLLENSPRAWQKVRGSGLGMIFQEPMTRLNPLMRVSEHFREAIRAHERISKRKADVRALNALRSLGIPPSRYKNYPHEFSGGMRQRIMIALALSMRPSFVVADEPTTALDVLVEAQIIEVLAKIRDTLHPAMMLITHNLGIIGRVCDNVAVMYAGRIVEQGSVEEVFGNPKHPYTQALLGATISMDTTELKSIPGAPPDLGDLPPGCRFAERCPFAMEVCLTTQPRRLVVEGREVECHLYDTTLTAADRIPLVRAELEVADEA
ncbi:MAG: dipeptide/oligopeptide/nickel ABC transporter permease/ATP-binding protein [Nakamurella sp.]